MNFPKTILLVEDDQDDQYFFVTALNEIEDVVLFDIVNNGKEALERLEGAKILPALIFMDINMPVMNGIECLSAIANNPKINNIPVVMLSSSIDQQEQARKLGAKAFLKKPNDITTLRDTLKQVINKKPPVL